MENSKPTQEPRVHIFHLRDHIRFFQGFDVDKADSTGPVLEETYREDARRGGTIRMERTALGKRFQVSGTGRDGRKKTRAEKQAAKLAEENDAAAAFASNWSERAGKVYVAEPKEVEKGDFPDVWMRQQSGGELVGIELRNFDEDAIGQLEKAGQYSFERTVDEIVQNIRNAIDKKNGKVSPKSAARTILVLISPYPIRPSLYEAIAEKVSSPPVNKNFLETWVLPLKQKPFRVQ